MTDTLLHGSLRFLAVVGLCGILIAATAALTGPLIEQNRARQAVQAVTDLITTTGPSASLDAAGSLRWRGGRAVLDDGRTLMRGLAPGYAGDIHWLAALDLRTATATVLGVRITAHRETPGIADFLSRPDRGWMRSLAGRDAAGLAGIDAVSGATITSQALRRSLADALQAAGAPAGSTAPR